MYDFPKAINIVRGGKSRLAIFIQPHLHQGGCYDILRLAFISL